ncbi:ABC transporter permease [Deinococcus pimensis]|uniref:YhgE/Pip domain-containing protein n=1 Tax=Deinococcus pimensis TaxID=309888 RepID=UPI000487F204|nr:ABC transporter permease [Deinococcus pimensis]
MPHSPSRHPALLVALLVSTLIITLYALINFGATLNPTAHTHDVPLIIVNADHGTPDQHLGRDLLERLQHDPTLTRTAHLTVLPTRDAALDALRRNHAWAALVIPDHFTRDLTTLPTTGRPARLEVLHNPAAGSAASSIADHTLDAVVTNITTALQTQVLTRVRRATPTVPTTLAATLAQPVRVSHTDAVTIGEHSGRGSSTFTLTFVAVLAGFMAANIIQAILTDVLDTTAQGQKIRAVHATLLKLTVGFATSIVGATVILLIARLFHLDHTAPWSALFGFVLLTEFLILTLTLMFYVLLGARGVVAAVLFNIVLFTALNGANQPLQTLPRFLETLAFALPFHAATDGARALLFLGGRLDAGLASALLSLSTYLALALIVSLGVSALRDRREAPTPVIGSAPISA